MNAETLQKFCYPEGAYFRGNMGSPFNYEGRAYATDGKILVRLNEEIPGLEEYPDFPYDRIKDNFDGPFKEPELLSPYRTEEETEPCHVCEGKGYISTCPECGGSGEVELDSGWNTYFNECLSCEGTGTLSADFGEECDNCGGTGMFSKKIPVKIGQLTFDNRLINKLLSHLPEQVMVSVPLSSGKPALLTWDGGQGLLMPLIGR